MAKELAYQIAHAELTKGQVRLAGYILKNQKRVLGMTALEVGREVGMSDASVIRFCRAVGYSGFANLKVQLQKELSLHSEKIGKHSLYDRFVMQEEKYSKDELDLSEMLTLMGGNLENSLRQNPAATFHTVADKLLSARKKIIIGLRGGKGCAVRFARLLQFLSSDVACISDEGQDELCSLAELTGQDVVLNFSRFYRIDEKMAEMLAAQQVPYFVITDSMASPFVKGAQAVLLADTEHCGFFHSMIGVEGILEYLLILMCWAQPESFRAKLQQRDAILAEYREDKN